MKKLFLILLLATSMVSACGGAGKEEIIMDAPMPEGAEDAMIVELEFTADEIIPNEVIIPAGQKVLFVVYNSDINPGDLNEDHNLVAPEIGLKEILVVPGQTERRLWTAYGVPGEYRVGCTIHPWIDMTFIIE